MTLPASHIPNPPKPKYELFQRISFVKRHMQCNKVNEGVITGLEYVSPVVALAEDIDYGWTYTIRCESGLEKPIEEYVGCNFYPHNVSEEEIISR